MRRCAKATPRCGISSARRGNLLWRVDSQEMHDEARRRSMLARSFATRLCLAYGAHGRSRGLDWLRCLIFMLYALSCFLHLLSAALRRFLPGEPAPCCAGAPAMSDGTCQGPLPFACIVARGLVAGCCVVGVLPAPDLRGHQVRGPERGRQQRGRHARVHPEEYGEGGALVSGGLRVRGHMFCPRVGLLPRALPPWHCKIQCSQCAPLEMYRRLGGVQGVFRAIGLARTCV